MWYHLNVESFFKKSVLIETENKTVIAKNWGWGKLGEFGKDYQLLLQDE